MRSYLYASDLAAWLWALLLRGSSGPWNVGSGDGVSIRNLAEAIGKAGGVEVRVARAAEPGRAADRYVPDVTKAGRELGLVQTVSLEASIARSLRWHRG